MKRYVVCLLCLFCVFSAVYAQSANSGKTAATATATGERTDAEMEELSSALNAQIAMSTAGYLVTSGDVYSLSYAAISVPVSYTILVDSSYKIRVSNLGILDASGMTFMALKAQVEAVVTKNYPMSGVQFVLVRPSAFTVAVKGEVKIAQERTAWPLSRLSTVLDANTTSYSSIRDVTITSQNGASKTCDLFRASRFGDLSQDPYLRPGDVVTVNRLKRSVTISGAVERPGTYQLLDGENFMRLLLYYANDYAPTADKTRVELTRYIGGSSVSGEKLYLNTTALESDFALQHFDSVTVSSIRDLLPVMFVEGAVGVSADVKLDASTRIPVQFNEGETYASMVRRNRAWFTAVSDTANAYIIRGSERIPINLNPMMYDANYRDSNVLQKEDILMIPFRQYFVTVSGAVVAPGRYPYIPDRSWEYYIAVAGGFLSGQNTNDAIVITDITGKKMAKSNPVTPETVITARANSFTYYFNQYAPVITTVLTVVSTILTVIAVTR
jgi:protein involved in polysaccharide export with SLBB domain